MDQGKTNQFGRREFGSCIRNKDPRVCPFGALGLYLFWRFHIESEEVPDFLDPRAWYDINLLKGGKDRTHGITYRAHYNATIKISNP